MNDEMAEPLLREIVNAWDQVLNHKVPALLQSFQSKLTSLLTDAFVKGYSSDLKALAVDAGRIERLTTTFSNSIQRKVQDAIAAISEHISAQQRDLNRSLPGDVQVAMRPAYQAGMGERGQGRTARIRAILDTHANKIKGEVFRGAAKDLHKRLVALVADLQQRFSNTEVKVLIATEGIYACLWAGPIDESSALAVRERLLPVLVGIARDLEALLCSDVGEPDLVTFRVDERMTEYEERRRAREEEREKRRQEVEKAEARQREQMQRQQEAEAERQRKAAAEQDARSRDPPAAHAPARDASATAPPSAANTDTAPSTAPPHTNTATSQHTSQSGTHQRGSGSATDGSDDDRARLLGAQQRALQQFRMYYGGSGSVDHPAVAGYTKYYLQRTDLYELEKRATRSAQAPRRQACKRLTSARSSTSRSCNSSSSRGRRCARSTLPSSSGTPPRRLPRRRSPLLPPQHQQPPPPPQGPTPPLCPHYRPTYTIITDDKDLASGSDGDDDGDEGEEGGEGEYDDYDHGGEFDNSDEEREEEGEYESASDASRTAEVAAIAKLSGEVEEVKTVGVHEAVHERVREAEDNGDIIDLCH